MAGAVNAIPVASASAPDASPRSVIPAALAPVASPQALMTNGSLTVTTMISSTPFARIASAVRTTLGIWTPLQVPVNAPGIPYMTTFRPFSFSARLTCTGPLSLIATSVTSGSLSPVEIAMSHPFNDCLRGADI